MSNGSCMICLNRKFGYVDFETEEDLQKAMELNGKKFMGQELKLDRARSKDSSQEGKKGKICSHQGACACLGKLLKKVAKF